MTSTAVAEPATESTAVPPMAAVWFSVGVFSLGPVVVASSSIAGPVFSFWRLWIAVPMLAGLAVWTIRRTGTRPSLAAWRLAALAGLGFGIHQVLFMSALKATSVVDVTLMNTLAPIVVGLVAIPMFGERPGVRFRLWSLLAIVGAAMIAVLGSTGVDGNPLGMLLAAGNVVAYVGYFVVSKQARVGIDTWPLLFGAVTGAAVVVSAYVAVSGTAVGGVGWNDLALCLFVAVVPGTIGHGSMTWALRYVPANVPPVVLLTIPVFSGLLAWVFIGQGVTAGKVLAGAVTLLGVLGAVRSPTVPEVALEAMDEAEES